MNRLPIVRLGPMNEDDHSFREAAMDYSDSKFGFAWPEGSQNPYSISRLDHSPFTSEQTSANNLGESATSPTARQLESRMPATPPTPRLSRAFSMPLPSQIAHFRHPARTPGSGNPQNPVTTETSASAAPHLQDLSLELADSLQMNIQTLLQLSPPHLFDAAKEQFSSCSVQIPATSLSALLTSMKHMNYLSANIHKFGSPLRDGMLSTESSDALLKDDFDIGELLQSVGDSLGGVAGQAGVDLVLHHGDVGIKHIGVKGDECGISYALTHVIHQVLTTTRSGDSIEIGLTITEQPPSKPYSPEAPAFPEGPVICTFDIAHRFFSSSVDALSPSGPNGEILPQETEQEQPRDRETRPEPQFTTIFLRRLLKHIGGTLRPSLQPQLFRTGRRCELAVTLERGPPVSLLHKHNSPMAEEMTRQFQNVPLAQEPTLEELTSFGETLRGRKVAFHASSQGSFAHHLTRYLTAWGMDISHVPTDDAEDKESAEDEQIVHADSVFGSSTGSSPGLGLGLPMGEAVPPIPDSASDAPEDNKSPGGEGRLSFVIIDDDILALRRRLFQHRVESMPSLHLHPRKHRPSLAANHRPRSSPSMRNTFLAAGTHTQPPSSPAFTPVPIVHFTSLARYKIVKEAIQAVLFSVSGPPPLLPEVIVIPKPAGPRRLLTALRTAVHKPVVDPFFLPIATSPMSHSGSVSPFMTGRKSVSSTTPPLGAARSDTAHSVRSPREQDSLAGSASSPLAIPEGLEYFPDAAVKRLGGNAASGLVIQSPDGRPAGIFFQPQSRTSSRSELSAMAMERERGAPGSSGSQCTSRRSGAQRVKSSNKADATEASSSATLLPPLPIESSAQSSNVSGTENSPPSQSQRKCPRIDKPAEFLRSYKGKGRVPASSSPEKDSSRLFPPPASWMEATQNLARQPATLPATGANVGSVITTNLPQSPTAGGATTSTRKTSQVPISSPVSRPPPSPPSRETRKSAGRRMMQGSKGPVASAAMKSRTAGNNIVPPISVLIVEDNAINQTILSTFMRRNKIKYEVAWNGREAVEKWRNGNFHLILMDIQMPVMDGIEATKEIRRLEKLEILGTTVPSSPDDGSRRTGDTPDSGRSSVSSTPFHSHVIIVALTASSLQSDRVAALAAGCNDFLTKPVTNSWLNDKVIEWGSIKALQMWAELRPEAAKNIIHGQEEQARAIANSLHVPFASTHKSSLSGGHDTLSVIGEASREASESFADYSLAAGKPPRRSSDKSSGSDSSLERWPVSSDEEGAMQDPITEPPAVIATPERIPIALPETDPDIRPVSGEVALLNYLEESKQEEVTRPMLLGLRARSSLTAQTSIASVMHDTPGAGGTSTDGLAAVSSTARDPIPRDPVPPEPPRGENEHARNH